MEMKMTKLSLAVTRALGAGVALTIVAVPGAMAQQAPDAPQRIEKIEVTGSNIKRIEGETALPVQIITREQIQKTGAANVEQLLSTLSVAVQGNTNTVAASGSGATTSGVSSASLRGLGSQRTLVLINGRRISGGGTITDSTSVDINSIPLAAIERIDVLKEGASAVYGSDAIAGVINFILRSDYQGAEATAYYGTSERGGGSVTRANGAVGFGDLAKDRYNFLFTGSYEKDQALFGKDREFSKSSVNLTGDPALGQFGNDTTSGNTFPANISIPDPDPTKANKTRNPGAPNNCAPSVSNNPDTFGTRQCRFDPAPFVTLLPKAERTGVYAAGHFAITDNLQLFGELGYTRSRQQFVIQPVPISDQFALPPNHPLFNVAPYNGADTIVLKSSSPFYPAALVATVNPALPDVLVRYRSFGTGLRDLTDTSEQPRVVAGVKGLAWGWDYDAALLYTQTKLTEHDNGGYPQLTKVLPLLNSGTVNFFGPNTPAVQAQLEATNFIQDAFTTKTTLESIQGKASKEIVQLPAGPLALAFGAEERKEKFQVDPNPIIQTGDVSGYGGNFLPIDKSRNVTGVFAELNIPIVKTLEGGVAVRYDDYQNTGSKVTPKVNLRWQPITQVLVRASYGRGFRAPSLTELYQPQVTGVTAQGVTDPLRCPTTGNSNDCSTQFPIVLGGNTSLKPEESDNYTLGLVLEPTNKISIGFDAFKIKLKDTIIFGITPENILADQAQFGKFVTRGPVDVAGIPGPILQIDQTNLNFGETRVTGVDVDLRFRFPAGEVGNFTIGLNGTYFHNYQIQNLDGSFQSVNGKVSPIVNGNNGVIPRWHHYLTADWTRGPWGLTVAQNFQSGYEDIAGTLDATTLDDGSPNPDFKPRRVGAYETYDLQGSFTGIKHLRFVLGVKNLLDRDPPFTNAGGQNFFQAGYDPGYADPRGRFYYGSLTYTFK